MSFVQVGSRHMEKAKSRKLEESGDCTTQRSVHSYISQVACLCMLGSTSLETQLASEHSLSYSYNMTVQSFWFPFSGMSVIHQLGFMASQLLQEFPSITGYNRVFSKICVAQFPQKVS